MKASTTASRVRSILILVLAVVMQPGCTTTMGRIQQWERSGDVAKLSAVASNKREPAAIRKRALESLARLNWTPSNAERLDVYSTFASRSNYAEAEGLMRALNAETFAGIDKRVVTCASLLTDGGGWTDSASGRALYNELRTMAGKAVTISLCQQVIARPELQTRLVLLGIKLGIAESEDELVAVLFEYGEKSMAEDYLNSGSPALADGARRWAQGHGYGVSTGFGSHRAGWGQF